MKRHFFGHNFAAVFRFEVVRTLKKKSFWVGLLAFPMMIGAVFGLVYWVSNQSNSAGEDLAKERFSIGITDSSGAILPEIIQQVGAQTIASRDEGINKIKSGQLDAYFYYPENLGENKVEIFAQNVGIFENGKYQSVAQSLLQSSALSATDPSIAAILGGKINFNTQTFRNGESYNPIMKMIAPGIFLVLFYLIIATFGAQMMNAVVEEKENRVSEMILTTIRARTLIVGKIFAFLALIIIQITVILTLVAGAYFLLRDNLDLPSFDLSQISLDPMRILIGFMIFIVSLLLLSGIFVALGAAMPTAKEANQYLVAPMMLIFVPLYLAPMLITNASAPAITFLTYFPFTAPVPLMLRNAVGNLTILEAAIGTALLTATAVIVFIIAARLFQTGAVEYSKKMSLKGLFSKKTA